VEAIQIIEETFLELEVDLTEALDGLNAKELAWSPVIHANSINFTLWHLSRAEDIWVSNFALNTSDVIERCAQFPKWNIPSEDSGYGYTIEQLTSFPDIPVHELWEYHQSVRRQSLSYLRSLQPADFDYVPTNHKQSRWGRRGYTIGQMFSHLVCELGEHVGHICYLRGLQRGLNK